jgi:hypothetical protein
LRQRSYSKKLLKDSIASVFIQYGFELTPENKGRIQYYAQIMPVVVGDIYSLVFCRPLLAKERKLLTYLSMFTPLMDDYFDKENLSADEIKERIFSPENTLAQNANEALGKYILLELHHLAPKSIGWEEIVLKLLHWQGESKRQSLDTISLGEIREITFNKGGYSFLLARIFLESDILSGENTAILHLGGLIQYIDDIFDIWEDSTAGIKTLATNALSIKALRTDYELQLKEMENRFWQLNYPNTEVSTFLGTLRILFIRAFVALEQFEKIEQSQGGIFKPNLCNRKDLICDMEQPKNLWRTFYFYRKYSKT